MNDQEIRDTIKIVNPVNCVSDNARLEQELATLRAENKSLKTSRDGLKALADMYQKLNGELKKEKAETQEGYKEGGE